MKKTIIILIISLLLGAVLALSACKSLPEIPNDMTQAQLIQKGQNAFSAGDYKVAEYYYQTSIQRYGNNTESYIESKYELGHLYLKTKDYDKAEDYYRMVLRYRPDDGNIPQKLDAIFWENNRPILISAVAIILGLIGLVIILWLLKLVFRRIKAKVTE